MWGALSSTEEGLFRGEGLWRKAHPQDRSLFLKIGKFSESSEGTISKGKVVTTSSILGHYPYTLSQTLAERQEAGIGGLHLSVCFFLILGFAI